MLLSQTQNRLLNTSTLTGGPRQNIQFVVPYGTHNLVGVVMIVVSVVVVIVAMIIPVMVVVVFVRPISLMHVPTIGIVVPVWMHIVGALIRRTVPVSGVPAVTPLERLPVTL